MARPNPAIMLSPGLVLTFPEQGLPNPLQKLSAP